MTDLLSTEPIRKEDILPAYPLIRSHAPALTLADWVRFARRAVRRRAGARAGIEVVRGRRPYPVGMFCWRIERDLAGRRMLIARHSVALELFDACPVTRALVAGAERLAARLGCASVESILGRRDETLASCLEAAGHHPAARIYGKSIECMTKRGSHEQASAPFPGQAL